MQFPMEAQEALELVNQILAPKQLNYLEEMLFLQTWSGKLYREIAIESGYELSYLRDVGSRLWSAMSEAIGSEVTKRNVRLILSNFKEERSWKSLEFIPLKSRKSGYSGPSHGSDVEHLAFPGRFLPSDSMLYVERPPIEELAFTAALQPGNLIRIRAPRQMGKTSLVYRMFAFAQERRLHPVRLSFHQADDSIFTSLDRLLRWICWNVSRQLGLEPKLEEYWLDEIGSKVSCTTYFQEYLLPQLKHPCIVVFDELSRLFHHADLAQDFLPLLRTWHEDAMAISSWQKLRIVIVHSTEIYVPLKVNQSPFNVGLPLQLHDFERSQIEEMSRRCNLSELELSFEDLEPLLDLVGGHPYLLQLAFYWMRSQQLKLPDILRDAPTLSGIYQDHLRQLWMMLQQHSDLKDAFTQVLSSPAGVMLDPVIAYRLEGTGLVRLRGNEAILSRKLYQTYFQNQ
jgi:hypothetical protein